MIINRDKYLDQLVRKKGNGLIKIITGIRRCGKSYLLFELFHAHLNAIGIEDDYIIELSLDDEANAKYRNPMELGNYIRSLIIEKAENIMSFSMKSSRLRKLKTHGLMIQTKQSVLLMCFLD